MLTAEKNRLLTEVGPGKPMGEYLRRYWHPVAGADEFDKKSVRAIRLFGEDLVLYKDLSGNYGLIERRCPHRNADLVHGYVEKEGLRCSYHGWQFGQTGQCLHQPFEEIVDPSARMRKDTKIKGYPVKEKAGMLWAYMGPLPAPELPDWDFLNFKNSYKQAVFSELPCNWFQCQENSIDPVHFEWTHNNWMVRQQDPNGKDVPPHLKLKFEEFDYGLTYKRFRGGDTEDNIMWTVGRVCLWPNAFYLGHHCEWRVPIDDENTLSVMLVVSRVPTEMEPYEQKKIPSWVGPLKDENGEWVITHIINQDFAAWYGQGRITDRTREKLGKSDEGVVMMRRKFFEELDALAEGQQRFFAQIWDKEKNKDVPLASACREEMIKGLPREEMSKHPLLGPYLNFEFFGQYGQPRWVQEEYEKAVGQKMAKAETFANAVHGAEKEDAASK